MSRHTLETAWCFDGSEDVDLVIVYDFIPGSPERGPSYYSGGEPAEPAECDVISAMIDGQPATDEELAVIQAEDVLWQRMVDNVEGE